MPSRPDPTVPVDENARFRHFSLQQKATAWISSHLFDRFTYTVRHGLLKGMKRKGGLGWLPGRVGADSSPEHRFLAHYDFSGMVVYDIGAFHGLMTLFFARRAATVVAFEPEAKNRKRLLENVNLNRLPNVQVRNVGLGAERGTMRMLINPLTPGAASVDSAAHSTAVASGAVDSEFVSIVPLDEEVKAGSLPAPNFIKIDVEGFELNVLRGARETLAAHTPNLFMEMHGESVAEKRRKVAEIVAFLQDAGYTSITHVESGASVNLDNSGDAMQGHLYCQCLR
jgi:FkbM family methyltransferase